MKKTIVFLITISLSGCANFSMLEKDMGKLIGQPADILVGAIGYPQMERQIGDGTVYTWVNQAQSVAFLPQHQTIRGSFGNMTNYTPFTITSRSMEAIPLAGSCVVNAAVRDGRIVSMDYSGNLLGCTPYIKSLHDLVGKVEDDIKVHAENFDKEHPAEIQRPKTDFVDTKEATSISDLRGFLLNRTFHYYRPVHSPIEIPHFITNGYKIEKEGSFYYNDQFFAVVTDQKISSNNVWHNYSDFLSRYEKNKKDISDRVENLLPSIIGKTTEILRDSLVTGQNGKKFIYIKSVSSEGQDQNTQYYETWIFPNGENQAKILSVGYFKNDSVVMRPISKHAFETLVVE